jgi:hypothetical protein
MTIGWFFEHFFGPTGTIEDLYDYEYDNYEINNITKTN